MLNAKSIKAVIVLNAAEVATLIIQDGKPFPGALVRVGDIVVRVPLNAKGVRRALAVIKENGVENTAVILQGRLKITADSVVLEEAGIAAQAKLTKEAPATEAVAA